MWVGRELIDDLSSGSMRDLYTAVGGECGAADLQQVIQINGYLAAFDYAYSNITCVAF